jgi:hypothetical protein
MDLRLLAVARRFRPDVLIAEAPVRASHVAFALRRPCIGLDDSECSRAQRWLFLPFVTEILTPECYELDLGRKQVRYAGYKELAYLHPDRFAPDASVLAAEGLVPGERFSVVRFVGWQAAHDIGQGGFSSEGRRRLVRELSLYGRVLLSCEAGIDPELAAFVFRSPAHRMHDLLYYASVCVTEGATVASECAVLGTPAVYMNPLACGYLKDQERRYGLVTNFNGRQDEDAAIAAGVRIVSEYDVKRGEWRARAARLVSEHIDVTRFVVSSVLKAGGIEVG